MMPATLSLEAFLELAVNNLISSPFMGQSGILKVFVQKQQKRHEKDSFVESFSLISELKCGL